MTNASCDRLDRIREVFALILLVAAAVSVRSVTGQTIRSGEDEFGGGHPSARSEDEGFGRRGGMMMPEEMPRGPAPDQIAPNTFVSTTLDESLMRSLENHPEIIAAKAKIAVAQAELEAKRLEIVQQIIPLFQARQELEKQVGRLQAEYEAIREEAAKASRDEAAKARVDKKDASDAQPNARIQLILLSQVTAVDLSAAVASV